MLKERVTRFTHYNTRKYLLSYGDEVRNDASHVWSWTLNKDGAMWSEGKKYTFKVINILQPGINGTDYVRTSCFCFVVWATVAQVYAFE